MRWQQLACCREGIKLAVMLNLSEQKEVGYVQGEAVRKFATHCTNIKNIGKRKRSFAAPNSVHVL